MKRYPEYKDSGVEWIGQIPEHWAIVPLKHSTTINRSALPETTEPGFSFRYIDIGNVNHNGLANPPKEMSFGDAPSRARRIVENGDTIVSTVRTYLKAIHFIGEDSNDLIVSTGFATLSPNYRLKPKFLYYTILNQKVVDTICRFSVGVSYPAINSSELGSIPIWFPDTHEQKDIAKYLDHKIHLIDTLIEKKQKKIEFLQEQRAAIINQAVTKGLNPNVKMKDSEIEWLGEVPEHWTILMLGKMAQLQRGHDLPDRLREEGSFPIVSSSGISGYHSRPKIKGPGVVTGRYGTLGKPFYIETDFWPLNTTLYVKNFHCNVPKFVFYMLHYIPFDIDAEKSAVPGVNRNTLHPLHVVRPPIEEQEEIVKYIEKRTQMVDEAIKNVQKQIEQIQEYRTTLISEVVTGKIDVRDEAIP